MCILSLLLLFADEPGDALAKKMLPLYVKEATEYALAVESAPKTALELKKEPIFEWSNPTREGVQLGVLFVWTRDGRPAVVGSIFSQGHQKPQGRQIVHEMHALDSEKLLVTREGLSQWKPKAGLARKELPESGVPAAAPAARLLQMKRLAQEFTGYTVDDEGKRWELRLLPAPLVRYRAATKGVIDGALFALVSTAGTDPEVLLLIEAKEDGGKVRWEYACGRFSDRSLYVHRKDKEIWTMVRNDDNPFGHDTQHLYRLFPDKVVSLDGKLLARIRVTKEVWWGEVVPPDDK